MAEDEPETVLPPQVLVMDRVRKEDRFSSTGTEGFNAYLERLEKSWRWNGTTEEEKCLQFASCVSSVAERFYASLPNATKGDWPALVEAFRRRFESEEAQVAREKEFWRLERQDGESYADLMCRIQTAADQAFPDSGELSKRVKIIELFTRCLPKDLQSFSRRQFDVDPETLVSRLKKEIENRWEESRGSSSATASHSESLTGAGQRVHFARMMDDDQMMGYEESVSYCVDDEATGSAGNGGRGGYPESYGGWSHF